MGRETERVRKRERRVGRRERRDGGRERGMEIGDADRIGSERLGEREGIERAEETKRKRVRGRENANLTM